MPKKMFVVLKKKYPDIPVYETTTIIHEGLDPVLRKAKQIFLQQRQHSQLRKIRVKQVLCIHLKRRRKTSLLKKEDDGVWNVSGPRLEKSIRHQ